MSNDEGGAAAAPVPFAFAAAAAAALAAATALSAFAEVDVLVAEFNAVMVVGAVVAAGTVVLVLVGLEPAAPDTSEVKA